MGMRWAPRGGINMIPWPIRKIVGYKFNWTRNGVTSKTFYIGPKGFRYSQNSNGSKSFDGPGLLNYRSEGKNPTQTPGSWWPIIIGFTIITLAAAIGLYLGYHWIDSNILGGK